MDRRHWRVFLIFERLEVFLHARVMILDRRVWQKKRENEFPDFDGDESMSIEVDAEKLASLLNFDAEEVVNMEEEDLVFPNVATKEYL